MTKFVVDASVVLHLASAGAKAPDAHELLAPTLLRSQALSALHEAVHRGEIPADVARAVSPTSGGCRSGFWATPCSGVEPGTWRTSWAGPRPTTEYVALTQLQADAFITLDAELARSVKGIVEIGSIDALT